MASKQELEVQNLDLQRKVKELSDELERAREGLPPANPDDGKLLALQDEYSRLVDRYAEMAQSTAAKDQTIARLTAIVEQEMREKVERANELVDAVQDLSARIDRVTDAKTVHDLIHNRNIDWDQPVAILKR